MTVIGFVSLLCIALVAFGGELYVGGLRERSEKQHPDGPSARRQER